MYFLRIYDVYRFLFGSVLIALATGLSAQDTTPQDSGFLKVETIFANHCFDCHFGESAESSFNLNSERKTLLAGGDYGEPAIVPGHPVQSSLFGWVTASEVSERMPPEGEALTKAEVKVIEDWIRSGAPMPRAFEKPEVDLWSFRPIHRPHIPWVAKARTSSRQPTSESIQNAIDAFVGRRLATKQLGFSKSADRRTLIRRLYLIALGLPPSPREVEAFVNDPDPTAYDRLVSRVLASPAYGERWSQHWLDIIRFGETHGFETNRERTNAWPFRDYVIDALNQDFPYDQFVREQIAGDQFGAPVATGFIVAGPHDIVKSPDINLTLMQRQDELSDIVGVTGTTFLGLTVGCARCHDHKFDPVSQKDFYSLQAVFAGVNHADRTIPVPPETQRRLNEISNEIATLKVKLKKFRPASTNAKVGVDDRDFSGERFQALLDPQGQQKNPPGKGPGFASDPGSADHAPNISGGQYTWWTNRAGVDIAAYRPRLSGSYRVWISWGAGFETHTRDAIYELDRDGELATPDRERILKVDQRFRAATRRSVRVDDRQKELAVKKQPVWSGFQDVGIVEMRPESAIVLKGGKSGTAITADLILFEAVSAGKSVRRNKLRPTLRAPVSAVRNEEFIAPVEAKRLRFTIDRSRQSEPCIDELEIFSGSTNVALASYGTQASSGGDFVHRLHNLSHINDGKYGNSRSWIAKQEKGGWVELEFPQLETIDRIVWARDREGEFADRVATGYRVEVARESGEWVTVATGADRLSLDKRSAAEVAYDFASHKSDAAKRGRADLRRLQALQRQHSDLQKTQSVYAGTFSQPAPTHRLYRGDPTAQREVVEPNTVAELGDLKLPIDASEAERRRRFAEWLTERDNPLLARVIVNRLWQHTFGTGIVATPNDFGHSGRPPSHPELLDWLASELIDSGWSLKRIHRLLLSSHTFRQSSQPRSQAIQIDGQAVWLWRFPPRRMTAETLRDSMLVASGVLNQHMGGPGFSGFEVELENVRHFFPKTNFGPADWRRMIYMTKVRQEKEAVFGAFDCPDASQVIARRSRSTTPLQALNLFNSRFSLQQSELFADRLRESSEVPDQQIAKAFQILYSRSPTEDELESARRFVKDFGLTPFCRALLNSNEFLFIQ